MKDFVLYLAQNILDNPDEIEVEENSSDYAYEVTLKVPQNQYGIVIGKKGKTISAIRVLSNLYLYNHHKGESNKKLYLKVEEK